MSSGLPATQLEYQLTVLNGPDKGAVYRLISKRVTIGRGSECDIILRDDNKVSRSHAQIDILNNRVEISDISDRNRILVNGDDTPRQELKHNSVIQLGETKLQFKFVNAAHENNSLQAASPRNDLNLSGDHLRKQIGANKKSRRSGGKPSLMPMITILAILAGFGYYMSDNGNGNKKKAVSLRSEEVVLRETAAIEAEVNEMEEERQKLGLSREDYLLVQSHYVKGFRDYNNGQYERAAESFKACLALMPTHKNCQQYYNDAERQFAQLINEQMKLGQIYKNQHQYAACYNAFNNVKIAVKVPTDLRFKEADVNAKYCEKKMEERY